MIMCSFDIIKADWTNLSAHFDNIDYFKLFENCVDSESVINALYTVIYDGFRQLVPSSNHKMKMHLHAYNSQAY